MKNELNISPSNVTNSNDVSKWKVDNVIKWLGENGFASIIPIFKENEIDGEILLELSDDQLETKLGIKSFGTRKKLIKAISEMNKSSSSSPVTQYENEKALSQIKNFAKKSNFFTFTFNSSQSL